MPITAAQIEPNGWVLKLTLSGASLGSFASYVFDTGVGQTPRVALLVSDAGFVPSGGVAVSATTVRTLYGGYAVRKPMVVTNPSPKLVDEVDLGGGVITCRIALSEYVYPGSTGLSLSTLAGWRSGESAQSGISVTNNSTQAAPLPVFRWALVPYDIATGSFRLSILCGSHHPVGFQPVAGVKFTATDGINTKTVWTTALSTDNSYGDNLRCHSVIIDPTTATALTEGLLRCDAEIYPFVGAMRSTDPAATRSLTGLATIGYNAAAETPFVVAYDPAGTRYANFAFIDYANGSATPAAAMVQNSLALAKAVAATSRPRDISVAIQALRLKGRSLTNAARSGSTFTNEISGLQCVLAAHVHAGGFGTFAVGSPANLNEVPVTIYGDPADSDPRNNCILRTQATASNSRATRVRLRNLTLETGFTLGGGIASFVTDGVTVRSQAGQEASTTAPWSIGPSAGTWNYAHTNSKFWRTPFNMQGQNNGLKSGLYRKCEMSKATMGFAFIKNRWIDYVEDGSFTFSNNTEGFSSINTTQAGDIGAVDDFVVAFNDLRKTRSAVITTAGSKPSSTASGTNYSSIRRHLILGNLIEHLYNSFNPSAEKINYGEAQIQTTSTIILEFNTCLGAGYNAFYNSPSFSDLATANANKAESFLVRHANNFTDRNASKHDDFDTGTPLSTYRGGGSANGFRPQLVDGWHTHMGVCMEAHTDLTRGGSDNFYRDFVGLRGKQYSFGLNPAPGVANDASAYSAAGTAATGGGNYTPQAGSPALGRVARGNTDVDFFGNPRKPNGASGAVEASGAVTDLAPGKARSALASSAGRFDLQLAMLALAGRSLQTARAAAVTIALSMAPASSRLSMTAGATGLGWRADLVPGGARQGVGCSAPAVGIAVGPVLLAAANRLSLAGAATLVCRPEPFRPSASSPFPTIREPNPFIERKGVSTWQNLQASTSSTAASTSFGRRPAWWRSMASRRLMRRRSPDG